MSLPNRTLTLNIRLAIAAAVLLELVLGAAYLFLAKVPDSRPLLYVLSQFLIALLPSLAVVPLVFLVCGFLFGKWGVEPDLHATGEWPNGRDSTSREDQIRVYPNYYEIPWPELLSNARSLDLVGCYWKNWVKSNAPSISAIFGREGTVTVVMSDPDADEVMEIYSRDRFPDLRPREIKRHVRETIEQLNDAKKSAGGGGKGNLKIVFFPGTLNYAAVRINGALVIYSAYEQFRSSKAGRIGNPGFVLDLTRSEPLCHFFDKEFMGYLAKGRLIGLYGPEK